MYRNSRPIATAGNTRPVKGTKIDGRKEAAIQKVLILWDANSHPNYTGAVAELLKAAKNL
jgi:hypothetical protein